MFPGVGTVMSKGKNTCVWMKVHTTERCGKSCMGSIVVSTYNRFDVEATYRFHVEDPESVHSPRRGYVRAVVKMLQRTVFAD